ncbi:MAG: polynucleotide adenylyltransferase PcnB [Treponema sp.]|nr:polynucleotide adenylyltransferase PcnB [Treponema sp.]
MRYRYSTYKDGKPVKKALVYTQSEHGINRADVDADAIRIVERLVAAGFETYIVGGAVRDLLLHKKPKDFDIVSSASPNQIKKIFRFSRIIGHRFRLVHVAVGEKIFEVATFRSMAEGATGNIFGAIEEDVLRRDFTLNALFYDPEKQLVIDYVGGMKDICNRRIKPIIPLKTIFTDDPVRIVRAVKYASAAGFRLPFSLGLKIKRQAHLLDEVSPSRRTEEILKIIRSSSAGVIVENLENFGLYQYLQPNASKLMRENPAFRETYLQRLTALNQENKRSEDKENLAALIWDYLEMIVDWNERHIDHYKKTFYEARQFVLPMNPPRFDLDGAVKLIYREHGVVVKRSLFVNERPWERQHEQAAQPASNQKETTGAATRNAAPVSTGQEKTPAQDGQTGEQKLKKRKRPHRKKPQRLVNADVVDL